MGSATNSSLRPSEWAKILPVQLPSPGAVAAEKLFEPNLKRNTIRFLDTEEVRSSILLSPTIDRSGVRQEPGSFFCRSLFFYRRGAVRSDGPLIAALHAAADYRRSYRSGVLRELRRRHPSPGLFFDKGPERFVLRAAAGEADISAL